MHLNTGVGPAVEGRPLQTEEGISEVIHRARQRRLQRERIDSTGSEDIPRTLKDVAQSTPRPGMLSRHSMHHGSAEE
jgi:hypothetical protein